MLDVAFATIFIFFIFTAIGLGPALISFKNNSLALAITAAPLFGLMLTTLMGTYLVLLDYPVSVWALPWLIISLMLSFCLIIYAFQKRFQFRDAAHFWVLSLGFIFTSLLVLAPMIIGGLHFIIFRGNGGDTFNYLGLAGYLAYEPYSWANTVTIQELIDKHPMYPQVKKLLTQRWSTSVILGWVSIVSQVPIQRIEYGFTALFFMMAYCCAFNLGLSLALKPRIALLVAIAINVGFWAQLVMDFRAMSQISTLPLLLFFPLLIINLEQSISYNLSKQVWLGMTLAAILFLYIELLPTVLLGILLFFTMNLLQKRDNIQHIIKKYWLVFLIFLLISMPILWDTLFHFLKTQISSAIHFKNDWDRAYFRWLYTRPLLGFWGFSFISAIEHHIKFILEILGILLTLLFFYLTSCAVFARQKMTIPLNIITAFLIAAIIEFIYLFSHHQLWAAGKAISYGYPFIYLFITSAVLVLLPKIHINQLILNSSKYLVLIWLGIHCCLGVYRVDFSRSGQQTYPYPYYIGKNPYSNHDWEIDSFTSILKENKAKSVGLLLTKEIFMPGYLALTWGWDMQIINLNPDGEIFLKQTKKNSPEYLIVGINYPDIKNIKVLVNNKELALIKTPPNFSSPTPM